jgi:hypothetical protein
MRLTNVEKWISGCHLSQQNQLSKPSAIHINNSMPNYSIPQFIRNKNKLQIQIIG